MRTTTNAQASKSFMVIDDFEDGNLREYEFDRGESGADVTDSVVKNRDIALRINGTDTEMISLPGGNYELDYYPEAGDTFSYWIQTTGGAGRTNFTYGVQDHDNRYFVRVNVNQGHFSIYRYENATAYNLADTGTTTLSEDEWYQVEIDWTTDGMHTATLYEADGTKVSQLAATDSTWTSGGVGYDAYVSDGGTVYFDYVTKGRYVIDNFEDGTLGEYSFDRGSSGASLVSSPTYNGSTALSITGTNTEMISTGGLNTYPEAGDAFRYHVRPADGAASNGVANVTYGVQGHEDRYYVQLDFTESWLGLARYENGSATWLDGTNVTFSEDTWYEVGVEWSDDGTHTIRLFGDETKVAQLSASDSTWTSGGVGYDAYVSDGGTVYFDYVTMNCTVTGSDDRTVVDDFEGGDLSEYSFDRGESGARIVESPTYNWGQALEISGTNTEMISVKSRSSDVGPYPRAGDVFSYWVCPADGAASNGVANVTYGVQGHEDRYYVQLDFTESWLGLARYENGSATWLDGTNVTFSEDTWYEVEVAWEEDGDHRVTVYDENGNQIAGLAGTDSTWTSGGVGYDAYVSDGGTVYFDYVTLGTHDRPNTATVTGDTGDGSNVDYELTVSGDVAKGELANNETISESTASGTVADGSKDSFEFSGEVTRFDSIDHLRFEVDRQNGIITVSDLRSNPSTSANYEFTVSGTLSKRTSAESSDSTSGGTGTGSLKGDEDSYDFSGELQRIEFVGNVIVDVDLVERPLTDEEANTVKTAVESSDEYNAMKSALTDDEYRTNLTNATGKRRKLSGNYVDELSVPTSNRGVPCRSCSTTAIRTLNGSEQIMIGQTVIEGREERVYFSSPETVANYQNGYGSFNFGGGA